MRRQAAPPRSAFIPSASSDTGGGGSPQTIGRIFEVQSNRIDLVIGIPLKIGVGYSLLPEGRVCCSGGTGGSLAIIDVDRRITFAYVMNKMAPAGGAPIAAALAERVKDIVKR